MIDASTEDDKGTRCFNQFQEKSSTGKVGLSNQGATCYLNSLIQTLYMTPEFRHALYSWKYDEGFDGPQASCIPLQLQRLFGRLSLGETAIAGTDPLTASFGWTGSDAFQQHDVQELLSKLFEAIEISFVRGKHDEKQIPPISALYRGVFMDYLQCVPAGHLRVRHDPFLEIPVPVGPEIPDLEASLNNWISPEILDGPWDCEKCGGRVQALKGMKISSASQFLNIQLKRFSYDPQTWQRIKLDNKLAFPLQFDIKPFLENPESEKNSTQYSLFSVLIHSGGAMGGHYYAMIKDAVDGKWYKFNDASVMEIKESDIEQMFGGPPAKLPTSTQTQPTPARRSTFSTNAYMLMYRRIEEGEDLSKVGCASLIPEEVIKKVEEENEVFRKEKAEWIKKRDNLPLQIFYMECNFVVHVDKNEKLSLLTTAAYQQAGLIGSQYTQDCVRLRRYNPKTGTKGRVWTSEETKEKTLDALGVLASTTLLLEKREPHESFPQEVEGFKLSLICVKEDGENFEETPIDIAFDSNVATVGHLRKLASDTLKAEYVQLSKVSPEGKVLLLEDDSKILLEDLKLQDGNAIHVEKKPSATSDMSLAHSAVQKIFHKLNNTIQLLYVLLPSADATTTPSSETTQPQEDKSLAVDQRISVVELRKLLAEAISLPVGEFKIFKNQFGAECADSNKNLHEVGFFDGQKIYLQEGKPMQSNEVTVYFVLYEKNNTTPNNTNNNEKSNNDNNNDTEKTNNDNNDNNDNKDAQPTSTEDKNKEENPSAPLVSAPTNDVAVGITWTTLPEIIVEKTDSASKLRNFVLQAPEISSRTTDPKKIRITLKKGARPGPMVFDNDSIQTLMKKRERNNEGDAITLVVQVLEEEDAVTEGNLRVEVQHWIPAEQRIDPQIHNLILPSSANVTALKKHVYEKLHLASPIVIAHPLQYQLKNAHTLPATLNWNMGEEQALEDGGLYLYKIASEQEREVEGTELVIREPSSATPQLVERGLKIYTIYGEV